MRVSYLLREPHDYTVYFGQEPLDKCGSWGTAKGTIAVFDADCGFAIPFDGIPHDFLVANGWHYELTLYRYGERIVLDSFDHKLGNPENFEKLWDWAMSNEPDYNKDVVVDL